MPPKPKWWSYLPNTTLFRISTSPLMAFLLSAWTLPNFWVCGLLVSFLGTLMLKPFVRKLAKLLVLFIDHSNQLHPTSAAPSTLRLFVQHSNMAVSLGIHWIPLLPNGLRPLSASPAEWSFNHGICLMKTFLKIPISLPSTSVVMLPPCVTFIRFFQIFALLPIHSSPIPDLIYATLIPARCPFLSTGWP